MIYAHQGGWDEILLVAGPIGVIVWLLWLADKRASGTRVDEAEPSPDLPDETPDPPTAGPSDGV